MRQDNTIYGGNPESANWNPEKRKKNVLRRFFSKMFRVIFRTK